VAWYFLRVADLEPIVKSELANSRQIARLARSLIVQMAHRAKTAHVGSSLSVVDILAVLYSGAANIHPENFDNLNRDFVLFSKGHAASAFYSILALKGFFPTKLLETYCTDGSALGGHVTHGGKPGVELSTGSLGHGLPYGIGIAMSQKKAGSNAKTFVIMSDGECDEGTTWESALLAQQFQLSNLIVIIDRNRLQSLTGTEQTLALEPFAEKWKAFNWNVISIDGHSHDQLRESLISQNGPLCVIAETTKGKGVSFMENSVLWHYRSPSDEELAKALQELKAE